MDDAQTQQYERLHDPSRVLALSDGVFAIVITLLVLEIHVPDLTQGQTLKEALIEVRPSFLAFLISFVVVAISWSGHRDLFALIRRTDRPLVWLNLAYLLPLSIVPFGASLLARFGRDPVALRLYGLMLVTIAAMRLVIWLYATGRPHLLYVPVDAPSRRMGALLVLVPLTCYALAFAIARSSPTAAFVIYAAVPIVYFIGVTFARSAGPPGSVEQEFT